MSGEFIWLIVMLGCKSYLAIFSIFVFSEYLIISMSGYFGMSSIGIFRDISLIMFFVIATSFDFKIKKNIGIILIFGVIFSVLNLYDNTLRMISVSILVFGLGMLAKVNQQCVFRVVFVITVFLGLTSIYQYFNYIQFSDYWFYDYFYRQYGDEYLLSASGYVAKDEMVRIVGPLVSPGVYGNLLVGLIATLHFSKSKKLNIAYYVIVLFLVFLIYLTNSRASQLGLLLYFILYLISIKNRSIFFGLTIFILFIGITFVFIFLSGEPSAMHRLLIWADFLTGHSVIIENSVTQVNGIITPRDSQFIAFLQSNVVFATTYIIIFFVSIRSYLKADNKNASKIYALVLTYFYISIFQWIGDTAFTYVVIFLFGSYIGNKSLIRVAKCNYSYQT